MIELQQWRICIGTFTPPTSRRSTLKERKLIHIRGLSTWTLLFVLAVCCFSSTAHPSPYVNTLLQAGDIELNPGPGMVEGKEILAEIKALRKEHDDHFEFLRNETSLIKSEMKNMRSEMEEMKNQIHTQSSDIGEISTILECVQEKVTTVEEEVEKLERYSRRENIVIYGVEENDSERTARVKSKLVDLLNEHAQDKVWDEKDFVRAHRLGTSSTPGRPRPIIARLKDHDDKFIVLKARNNLKVKGVGVSSDLTPSQRKELSKLRDAGKRGYYKGGQLCIDPNPLPPATGRFSPTREQEHHSTQQREHRRHNRDVSRRQTPPSTTGGRVSRNESDSHRRARSPRRRNSKARK